MHVPVAEAAVQTDASGLVVSKFHVIEIIIDF